MTLDLERELRERGALLEGHFRLSSGRHSDRFIQKFRILEDPRLVEPLARQIADAFRDVRPTMVLSAAVGGIVLGYEVACALGVKAIFAEKEGGVAVLRRGFALTAADRVLVVEDVITTGGSLEEIMRIARDCGAAIAGIGAIVRRGEAEFTVPVVALLELPIVSYEEGACPQCRAGVPIADPGSRRA